MMGYDISIDGVNLETRPERNDQTVTQVTLGDLHSNAIKLIHTLVRYGVCDIEKTPFGLLFALYNRDKPTEEDKKDFVAVIGKHLQVKKTDILVRLIGDIVADRGQNDLYVLAILDVLREQDVRVSTLISNHDVDLIRAYEAYKRDGGDFGEADTTTVAPMFTRSIQALKNSIGEGKAVSNAEFERLMETSYLPTLKLIDYSLSEAEPKKISIFSHAPIDLDVIEQMAKKFGVTYKASTVEALAQTMDDINQKFVAYVRDGNFNLIYDPSKIGDSGRGMVKENCVEYAIWNRNEDLKAGSTDVPSDNIIFVYGHTNGGVHRRNNVVAIDNILGRPDGRKTEGDDIVFVSDELHPTLDYADSPPDFSDHILWELRRRVEAALLKPDLAQHFQNKRSELSSQAKAYNQARRALNPDTDGEAIAAIDASIAVTTKKMESCIYFQTGSHLDTPAEAGKHLLIAEFGIVDKALIEKILNAELQKKFIPVIEDALAVLKKYSAGTKVSGLIEAIEIDLKSENFKGVKAKIKQLEKNSFEGLGGKELDADKRGRCETAWYNVIAGIRFFLGLITSVFTKEYNSENTWAKSIVNRPFFFQKPTTKGEDALIEKNLGLLESAKADLEAEIKSAGLSGP
ncbi:MAG: hypothetical protein K0U37_00440 [Gammaproteobacteria bacterium]|nr:hypothetical protein [Gammaproteobacteria bacterium]